MIVTRCLIDRHRACTAIFLPGEEPRIIPTSDYKHGRILQLYKQTTGKRGSCASC